MALTWLRIEYVDSVPAFNGSYLVKIDWTSVAENCWFNLRGGVDVGSSEGANSPGFKVVTKASTAGLPTATTNGPTSTPTSTPTSPPTTNTTPTTSPTAAPGAPSATPKPEPDKVPKEKSGMSTGAKIALGLVIPIAVIAILAGLLFFMRRRKAAAGKQSTKAVQGGYPDVSYTGGYREQPKVDLGPQELQAHTDNHLHESTAPAEMDSSQMPALAQDGKVRSF